MKTVFVVGASGGIGNKVASYILEEGYKVVRTYFRHPEKVENLQKFSGFSAFQLDLRDMSAINEIKIKFDELYAVVNCSGVVQFEGDTIENDIDIWNKTVAINLTGNYLLAKYLQEILEGNGRFIMMSSTDSYFGGMITASYAASKSGVNSLTKSLSLMLQDKKVRVNSIAPGWVLTPIIEGNGDKFLDKIAAINPLKRNAKPDDIANLISFLLSEKADYINGQVIPVEGGYTNQDPTLLLEEEIQ